MFNLVDHFHSRGLYRSIFSRYTIIIHDSLLIIVLDFQMTAFVFYSIMEGEESLRRYSPEVMVQDPNFGNAVSLLPPIVLFHGTGDYSIPSDARFEPLL